MPDLLRFRQQIFTNHRYLHLFQTSMVNIHRERTAGCVTASGVFMQILTNALRVALLTAAPGDGTS